MPPTNHILVVTGTDLNLRVDYSVFDAVRDRTGIGYNRLDGASFKVFAEWMERLRVEAGEMPDVHLALHMGPEGAYFSDRLVKPEELSMPLSGVNLAVLAGCESTSIGDYLMGIPYVVTLLEKVEHRSAMRFSQVFWLAKCSGFDAKRAYDLACKRIIDVATYAHFHNHADFLVKEMM